MATTTNRIISSEDEDEDNDDDLDSSFIDDLEQSEQSTNMTKQYLQSVKYVVLFLIICELRCSSII